MGDMKQIYCQREGNRIVTRTPYSAAFVEKARALGGRWDHERKIWSFHTKSEQAVRDGLVDIYGTDGTFDPPEVTVRLRLKYLHSHPPLVHFDHHHGGTLEICGCPVYRPGPNHTMRFSNGAAVIRGDTRNRKTCVIEVDHIPGTLAAKLVSQQPKAVAIVDGSPDDLIFLRMPAKQVRALMKLAEGANLETEAATLRAGLATVAVERLGGDGRTDEEKKASG